ncbi:MAG TPA: AAA family ATPase [Phycisphaerae bacterium]|nr:AAA family ATPase [Phycisphaerae bacterium]HOI56241.1 AAA family ATPase [Phycisphaerae bacterium]
MDAEHSKAIGSGTGLILGKFMPPHLGHQYLVDFGRHYVRELTVLVCSLPSEPISGELRYRWMCEMFPQATVRLVHVTDDLPQEPKDHPQFWQIWHDVVRRYLPSGPDFVFACEDYGYRLAEILGARYIPVDRGRDLVPVSATAIRNDPMAHWRYIPPVVRPYYVRRVCLFGPESTGKTTLAADLAKHYDTVWVGEHARPLLDHKAGVCDVADIPLIARGQIAAEEALARQANRILICDTDPLLTTVWSDVLFNGCPDWLHSAAEQRHYDLYLLLDVDVPWVQDGQRYLSHARRDFFVRCRDVLTQLNRPFVGIKGNWDERLAAATRAIDDLLSPRRAGSVQPNAAPS